MFTATRVFPNRHTSHIVHTQRPTAARTFAAASFRPALDQPSTPNAPQSSSLAHGCPVSALRWASEATYGQASSAHIELICSCSRLSSACSPSGSALPVSEVSDHALETSLSSREIIGDRGRSWDIEPSPSVRVTFGGDALAGLIVELAAIAISNG